MLHIHFLVPLFGVSFIKFAQVSTLETTYPPKTQQFLGLEPREFDTDSGLHQEPSNGIPVTNVVTPNGTKALTHSAIQKESSPADNKVIASPVIKVGASPIAKELSSCQGTEAAATTSNSASTDAPPGSCDYVCGGANEAYTDCGSACGDSCRQYLLPSACTFQCVPGCFCLPNYYRHPIRGVCVAENQCPSTEVFDYEANQCIQKACGLKLSHVVERIYYFERDSHGDNEN